MNVDVLIYEDGIEVVEFEEIITSVVIPERSSLLEVDARFCIGKEVIHEVTHVGNDNSCDYTSW